MRKMKVKHIAGGVNGKKFEDDINDFIKDVKVIDIKYSETAESSDSWYSALILYENIQKPVD